MKRYLFACFFLVPFILSAQTKMVTREDMSLGVKEVYHVLKSDKQTLEGEYKVYNLFGGGLRQEGFFHLDKKDSLWKDYGNKTVILEGAYKEDQKVGI